ncbi:MAG: hypothetical protein Kow0069_37150 [Promethearchaeota archaeon]
MQLSSILADVEPDPKVRNLARTILGDREVFFVDLDAVDDILDAHPDDQVYLDLGGEKHDLDLVRGATSAYLGRYVLLSANLEGKSEQLLELIFKHEKISETSFNHDASPRLEDVREEVNEELTSRLDGLYPEALEDVAYELGEIIHENLLNACVDAELVRKEGEAAVKFLSFVLDNYEVNHPDYYLLLPLVLVETLVGICTQDLLVEYFELDELRGKVDGKVRELPSYSAPAYARLREHLEYLIEEPFNVETFSEIAINVARLLSEFVNDLVFGLHSSEFYRRVREGLGVDFEDLLNQLANASYDPFTGRGPDYPFLNAVRKFLNEEFYYALYFNEKVTWLDQHGIVDLERFWRRFETFGSAESDDEGLDESDDDDEDEDSPFALF